MDRTIFLLGDRPVTLLDALGAGGLTCLILLLILTLSALRTASARRNDSLAAAERQRELDDKMAQLASVNAELMGRLRQLGDIVATGHGDMSRVLAERLDQVSSRVGQGLEAAGRNTTDQLARLGERLAVIDAAQNRLTGLTQEVVGLKDILANKQSRGAFGQGRMEAIVRDGLPADAYVFQHTLPNGTRPDCVLRLPGDGRMLVVDAKFPLEGFAALRDAGDDDARRAAMQRVRNDIGKHVRDIASKYLQAGVTQDIALMFVPSESIYADLNEQFEDVVQKAHRARVVIVSPSLLMLAIQLLQTMVRDQRMQEQAHLIQREVRAMLEDVRRLGERVGKLDLHFRQVQDDVAQIATSSDKIGRRGARIEQMEFSASDQASAESNGPDQRKAQGGKRPDDLFSPAAE